MRLSLANRKSARYLTAFAALSLMLLCVGCSSSSDTVAPEQTAQVYTYSGRQLAPEPVYNRLRWVELPDVVPSRESPKQSSVAIQPVMRLSVDKVTLEELATLLANSVRYRSYCSGLIAHREVTLDLIGDVDELAAAIETAATIRVVVDHDAREVRFFQSEAIVPRI